MRLFINRIHIFIIGLGFFILSFVATQKIFTQLAKAQGTGSQLAFYTASASLTPNQTFDVNIGLTNLTQSVTAVDAVVVFDSDILEVQGVTLGTTDLKTLVPQDATGSFDLTKALQINATNSAQSILELGLVTFDPLTQLVTPPLPITGNYDPSSNPIVTVQFKTKTIGATAITFKYDGNGITIDSNIVTNDSGDPTDILSDTPNPLNITVAELATPVPSTTPLPSPIECTSMDYNSSGSIDVQDIMQASSRWNTKTGDTNYDVLYDLNNDGQINIIDIQTIAGRWNENCVPVVGTRVP